MGRGPYLEIYNSIDINFAIIKCHFTGGCVKHKDGVHPAAGRCRGKMKLPLKKIKLVAVVGLLLIMISGGSALAGKNGQGNVSGQQALSQAEIEALIFLREEEKLARDVYLYLYDVWGQWIFENIAASEQQHMDAVKKLLDKYNLDDPAEGQPEGEFTDSDLQDLYVSLTETGTESKLQALSVGATIEDMDIFDLQNFLELTDKADITRVFENLTKGSRNHLRAFVGQMELLGGTYKALYLTQEEVDEIVNSERETGRY